MTVFDSPFSIDEIQQPLSYRGGGAPGIGNVIHQVIVAAESCQRRVSNRRTGVGQCPIYLEDVTITFRQQLHNAFSVGIELAPTVNSWRFVRSDLEHFLTETRLRERSREICRRL